MESLTIDNRFIEHINKNIKDLTNEDVDNQNFFKYKNINLELINPTNEYYEEIIEMVVDSNLGYKKEELDNENTKIITINHNQNIVGYFTFEYTPVEVDSNNKFINLVALYIKEEYRKNKIAFSIVFSLLFTCLEMNLKLFITEPNEKFFIILYNCYRNAIEMCENENIIFDDDIDVRKHLNEIIYIKIQYFSKERFINSDIDLCNNDKEYNLFKLKRFNYDFNESINMNINSYLFGLNECEKNNSKPYDTNIIYYINKSSNTK